MRSAVYSTESPLPEAPISDPVLPRLAALSDRYQVECAIGQGGMATVYRARDLKHGRTVAIKVLRPELTEAVGAQRFLREISIAAQLQSPHILPLLDSGTVDGLLYYVMPFVAGESLRDRLTRDGKLPPAEALRLLREIVDGLAHAHRHGVIHRDIKPDNVMLAEGHAMVMDFGIGKALAAGEGAGPPPDGSDHGTLTELGISLGTPDYMAPEQVGADPTIDHRADLYSVGVMAYEMLTGRLPFTGSTQAVIVAQIATPPPPMGDTVPSPIAAIVLKCLAKEPADRWQGAEELLAAIDALAPAVGAARSPARRRVFLVAGVALLALGLVAAFNYQRMQRRRWLRETALPEMRRMLDAGQTDSAWYLAHEALAKAPHDSSVAHILDDRNFFWLHPLASTPAGARVSRASLVDTTVWHDVGTTPADSMPLPRQIGLFRYQKPGYRTLTVKGGTFLLPQVLDPVDAPDSDMITIAGAPDYDAFLLGTDGAPRIALHDFRMDRYETSNRQFKAFVDAGGYRDSTWWTEPFHEKGRTLGRTEAMARFVDQTGRPGPAGWVAGSYPTGQGDLPVGGVSWYEAAAYAKWRGKSLPTVYHWARAAWIRFSLAIIPESNLGGTGPLPVGRPHAVSATGISDLAGNVREWTVNESRDGQRYILGGGWTDATYAFSDAFAQPPMDRALINGIRLVRYDPADNNVAIAARPITPAFTDYTTVPSAPDAVFASYRQLFDYDRGPLDAKLERADTTDEEWNTEYVTFNAAYGGERMGAWVYLPKHGTPPYQLVLYFPGSGTINTRSSQLRREVAATFVVKSGRALVMPIYKSTYERSDSLYSDVPDPSIFFRDHMVMWVKDARRALDYTATRRDIDTSRVAYFGFSWGGSMGGIIPAVEPRIKAVVLYLAGFDMTRSRPEVDPVNFLPHVTVPVLMLSGKYDFYFPPETSARPFFERLGTPAANKRWVIDEGGHDVPRPRLISETLAWLDKYLGVVGR